MGAEKQRERTLQQSKYLVKLFKEQGNCIVNEIVVCGLHELNVNRKYSIIDEGETPESG